MTDLDISWTHGHSHNQIKLNHLFADGVRSPELTLITWNNIVENVNQNLFLFMDETILNQDINLTRL